MGFNKTKKSCVTPLPHPNNVVMLDFEASSLSADSYVVEVGTARILIRPGVGVFIFSVSSLVKPGPDSTNWNNEEGSPDKGAIHGISRVRLEKDGRSVQEIAKWLNDTLTGKIVLCDTPDANLDRFWLNRLYEEAGITRQFKLFCVYDFIDRNDEDYDRAQDKAHLGLAQHRAGKDATDLMKLYIEYYRIKNPGYTGRILGVKDDVPSPLPALN